MSTLNVYEHSSPQYPPRTYQNARLAGLTVAFATDFDTAGERLTHKAAGVRYLPIPLGEEVRNAAMDIVDSMRRLNAMVLNIAGNGIYTLSPKGWTQERANSFLYYVLKIVHEKIPIAKVISGGQTGIDLAGVTAAHALGIPAEATLPMGFLQRGLDNKDRPHTQAEILEQIRTGAERLTLAAVEIDPEIRKFAKQLPTEMQYEAAKRENDAALQFLMQEATAFDPTPPARQPRLYNIKRDRDIPNDVVYIGRGTWRGQKSLCANPWHIGIDGTRNEVCDRFEEWAPTQPEVMAAIESLRGRDLACYCTPYRCHGDWILKMANREIVSNEEKVADAATAEPIEFDPQI